MLAALNHVWSIGFDGGEESTLSHRRIGALGALVSPLSPSSPSSPSLPSLPSFGIRIFLSVVPIRSISTRSLCTDPASAPNQRFFIARLHSKCTIGFE